MLVPFVPHTTVINRSIVYSNNVLPVEGTNLKVRSTRIYGGSLLKTIKKVIEDNPNVIFDTIRYSKKDNRVYFYTYQAIQMLLESKPCSFITEPSKSYILEAIKKVFLAPKNKNNDCVSLYDILFILKKMNMEYDSIINKYNNVLESIAHNKINCRSSVRILDVDTEKNIIRISFNRYGVNYWNDIYFTKQNGDLFFLKSEESNHEDDVFFALSSTLSEAYEELSEYSNYKDNKYSKNDIKAINSNFSIRISSNGVWLFANDLNNKTINEFQLFAPSYKSGYELKCNSNIVSQEFYGKETDIFKRIYVKIDDCPECIRHMLRELREYQLAEEQKIEEEKKFKEELKSKEEIKCEEELKSEEEIKCEEEKSQKGLKLTRKIFPFFRK